MTSTSHITQQSVQQTARLTERLQQTASAQPGTTRLQPQPNEREIIEDLNATIHGIIADTPLMLPEPIPAVPETPPQNSMARRAEGDELTGWLSRPRDEGPEPKSRSHVATLCAGTMMLSILAGYGSAQLLNRSMDATDKPPRDWTANASSLGFALDWSTSGRDNDLSDASTVPERVRVEPVRTASTSVAEAPSVYADDDAPVLRARETNVPQKSVDEPTERASLAVLATDQETDGTALEPEAEPIETAALAPTDTSETTKIEPTVAPPAKPTVPEAEATRMLERASRLIANGDIAGARLILRHLAEAGHGPAALKLAQVYDADWLASNSSGDIPANRDLALRWYAMARDRGQSGAAERVDALQALDSED